MTHSAWCMNNTVYRIWKKSRKYLKIEKWGLDMNERIKKLTELTLNGDMYVSPVKTEFDRVDLFLSKTEREIKRLCEYIKNQQPKLSEYSKLTGFFRCDG